MRSRLRRQVLIAAAAVVVAPFDAVLAQSAVRARPWRIGFLAVRSRPTSEKPDLYYDAFVSGLRERGYVEGRNIIIEWRFADGKLENVAALAAELAKLNLDVIVTHSTPAAQIVHRTTREVPIVFIAVGNPVESGLAASLARPGGNVTGQSNMTNEVSWKQLELLKSLAPATARVAVLVNPANATGMVIVENVQAAAQRLGVKVFPVHVRGAQELEAAFQAIAREQGQALIVAPDSLFIAQRAEIVRRAAGQQLASIFPFPEDAMAGGLLSYGPQQADIYRRGAMYVDRILKGARPADLPIEQPTRFELVVNAKTAAALGLKIPGAVLSQADRVID